MSSKSEEQLRKDVQFFEYTKADRSGEQWNDLGGPILRVPEPSS